MHVGYDAAECHHILGYLKIDLPACVCVCLHCSLAQARWLFIARFFTLPFRSVSVVLLMQWCSTIHGAGVGYM